MSDLAQLRKANRFRQDYWPGHERAADIEFRCIEFAGEAGEVSDAVKKLLRHDRGVGGNGGKGRDALITALIEEVGDALISLDMLADAMGIDMRDAIVEKLNKTSRKNGIPVMMHPETLQPVIVEDVHSPFSFYGECHDN